MRIGIALEGGGVRCAAQAGALAMLAEMGFRPAMYAGCGTGALVAALAAADRLTGDAVHAFADAAFHNAALRDMRLNSRLRSRFGGMALRDASPLAMPTVDLESGAIQVLASMLPIGQDPRPWSRQALVSNAVRAAMALPGALPPAGWRGRRLMGGNFLRGVLPTLLTAMGAEQIITIRVLSEGCAQFERLPAAQAICAHAMVAAPPPRCDLLLTIDGYAAGEGVLDRHAAQTFYRAGQAAARKALPALETLTGGKSGKILYFPGAEERNAMK